MEFARAIFAVLLIAALVAYGLDCSPTATAEQAMQCCKSMQCMRHHHQGQDCCKTMPTARRVIGQPSFTNVSVAPVALGMAQQFDVSVAINFSDAMIAEHSHGSPISGSLTLSPLRI
jgi:hypothetical protein